MKYDFVIYERVSEWLLFNANSTIFQLYHGDIYERTYSVCKKGGQVKLVKYLLLLTHQMNIKIKNFQIYFFYIIVSIVQVSKLQLSFL